MTRLGLLLLALLLGSGVVRADDLRTPEQLRALTDQMMKRIVRDELDAAVQLAAPYWQLPKNELDLLVLKTTQQRNLVGGRFGNVVSYEFLKEQRIGDWASRLTYIEKRERHIIRWQFTFYRPKQTWTFNALNFDDNLQATFPP